MIFGSLFQQLYQIIDSIIVGKFLGNNELTAVGESFPIIFLMISLIIGISSGTTIIIGQNYGAKRIDEVKKAIETMYIFLFFASILLSVLGILFSESIFKLIHIPEEALSGATLYLDIYVSGFIFFFGFHGTNAILRGLGDSKTPFIFLIISTLLNIGLDLLFILPFKWGIAGAAIATVISQAIAFVLSVIYLKKKQNIIHFSFLRMKFYKYIFNKSIQIGLPTGLQQAFVALGFLGMFRIVNIFGTNVTAAYSIAMRIDGLAAMPGMNFAAALATFVSQNLGANKFYRIKKGLKFTYMLNALVSIGISAVIILFRYDLIAMFANQVDGLSVIQIGGDYLLIVAAFYIVFSTMFITSGVLRGAGDTLIPMFITLLALWVIRIPLAYYFAIPLQMNEKGIWWAIPTAWMFGMIFSYLYYLTGRWKKKSIIKPAIIKDDPIIVD